MTPPNHPLWKQEVWQLSRYAGSGSLNTAVGFGVIFALMALGVSPLIANIGGYLVGFVLGFVVSRKFVFRSNGHFVGESLRYLAAFAACFLLNLWILHTTLNQFGWNTLVAQLTAAAAYTTSMYVCTRWLVFTSQHPSP